MKIAIALYGDYSEWYKCNRYSRDVSLFAYTLNDNYDSSVFRKCKSMDEPIHKLIPKINTEHQTVRRVLVYDYCCNKLVDMITDDEKATGEIYDIKIFTNFKTLLLDFPTLVGIYYTPYYSFVPLKFPNSIPCIEIVSDTHIRENGGQLQRVVDLPMQKRKELFGKLWPNQVYDYTHFKQEYTDNVAIFIPSVINTSGKPFDYVNYRSVFTPQERLQQTSEQVESIVEICDEINNQTVSYILEGSDLNLGQLKSLVHEGHCIILFSRDTLGNHYANVHSNKSIYEIYVVQKMLEKVNAEWYFKFGGRYKLTAEFEMEDFLKQTPVYKIISGAHSFGKKDIIECILYSFPKSYREKYERIYASIRNRIEQSSESIETLLFEHSPKFETVETLGVFGKDAIEGFDHCV